MVSSMGAGGSINVFIQVSQGGREQGTPQAQLDMHDTHLLFAAEKKW